MFKFLGKYLLLLPLVIGYCGCDNNSDNPQQPEALFPGLSRYSLEQQSSSNNEPAGLSNQKFAKVLPGYDIRFPLDHTSHPEFAVEWWYITANLTDELNNPYALQWTLFRFASESQKTPWANAQQYMGHVGLRDGKQAWFEERFARGGVGNAGVSATPFNAFIDDWQWLAQTSKLFPSTLEFTIDSQIKVNLEFTSSKPFVKHGAQGFSRKLRDSNQASYYYSQPHIQVSGVLELPNQALRVSGNAWFDHEWSSQLIDSQTKGWDWFSIHFDDGAKLMLFNMRHQQKGDFWSGTLIKKGGKTIHLSEQDFQGIVTKRSKVAGRLLPLYWSIQIPEHQIDILISPMQIEQWNPGVFSYYEGGTVISGSHSGVGFIELTGY